MSAVDIATKARRLVRIRAALPPPDDRRAIRVRAGLSRAEVAELVGVTAKAVAKWENGSRHPRPAHADRYARVLLAIREATSSCSTR